MHFRGKGELYLNLEDCFYLYTFPFKQFKKVKDILVLDIFFSCFVLYFEQFGLC